MKTTLSTLLLLVGATAARPTIAGAQGLVRFDNATTGVFISTNSVHGGPPSGLTWPGNVASNAYYYALLVAPTNQLTVDSSFAGWTFTGNYATNWRSGMLSGNYDAGGVGAVIIPGYFPGDTANFVVVGWSANVGHDWGVIAPLVQNGSIGSLGFFAISQVGVGFFISGGTLPVIPVLGTAPYQIPGFTLDAPIPEPSGVIPMAVAAAVWVFKSRKCVPLRSGQSNRR